MTFLNDIPGRLFNLFSSFQTNITIILQQINANPVYLQCWHSNPRPSEHVSSHHHFNRDPTHFHNTLLM